MLHFVNKMSVGLLILILVAALSGCVSGAKQIGSKLPDITSSYSLENKMLEANNAYNEGRLVNAERLYLNIVAEHRSLTDAWFKLGNIYYRSGRYKAAINAYETVLKYDPEFQRAWYNMALTRISQSVETLDLALANLPVDSPLSLRAQNLKQRYVGGMRSTSPESAVNHDKETHQSVGAKQEIKVLLDQAGS